MSITRLLQSASQLHAGLEAARTSLHENEMSEAEWNEIAGNYDRAVSDLSRINRRTRLLRGRIHFDAEML